MFIISNQDAVFFLFSFFKFSTFAFNKLESSPPANSGLFNLTSSPFEIQFSDQIQSKHSLGCFLSFDQKCFGVWVQKFESALIIIRKGNFISNLQKSNFLLEFELLSFVCYKLYSCEAKRLFLSFVHPHRRLSSFTIHKCKWWHEIYFYKCTCNETKYILPMNIWWQDIDFFKCICDGIIGELHRCNSPL